MGDGTKGAGGIGVVKSQREVSHLLRIAYEVQAQAVDLSIRKAASPEMLATINGYIQGLQRAAGEIATLAGDSLDDIVPLDGEIFREIFAHPAQG